MKLSVSLPDSDVEFLDVYLKKHDLESRSAALHAALRAVRDLELSDEYEAAGRDPQTEDPAALAEWQELWTESGGSQFATARRHPPR